MRDFEYITHANDATASVVLPSSWSPSSSRVELKSLQRLVALRLRDEWKRAEDVLELPGAQLIQRRDARVQGGERSRVWPAREQARERGDVARGRRGRLARRERQLLHGRRR